MDTTSRSPRAATSDIAHALGSLAAVAAVTTVYERWLHVGNTTTVALSFLLIVLVAAATSRLWVAGLDVGRLDDLLQLLLPAAGRDADDRGPAELGRAARVPRRQPRGEQSVVDGAGPARRGALEARRGGAAVRSQPRRSPVDRQRRGDCAAGQPHRPALCAGLRRDLPAAGRRVARGRGRVADADARPRAVGASDGRRRRPPDHRCGRPGRSSWSRFDSARERSGYWRSPDGPSKPGRSTRSGAWRRLRSSARSFSRSGRRRSCRGAARSSSPRCSRRSPTISGRR